MEKSTTPKRMDLGATGREGERTDLDLDRTTGMESHGGGDGVRDGEDGGYRAPSPHHAPPSHAPPGVVTRPPARRQGVDACPQGLPCSAAVFSLSFSRMIETLAPVPSHRWGFDLRRRRSIAWWPVAWRRPRLGGRWWPGWHPCPAWWATPLPGGLPRSHWTCWPSRSSRLRQAPPPQLC